jgi:hypothetical protein
MRGVHLDEDKLAGESIPRGACAGIACAKKHALSTSAYADLNVYVHKTVDRARTGRSFHTTTTTVQESGGSISDKPVEIAQLLAKSAAKW